MIPETVQALHQMEIWSGSFAFQVPLPVMVDPEQAQADYQAGFLKICLPKQGAAEHPPMSTRIQVQEEP
jgi:HSP20 family molecular chaperone IbpA